MPRQYSRGTKQQKRIESYLRRHPGASVAEARGHGAPGRYERALQQATQGVQHGRYQSFTEAARKEHVPVEKLRNYARSTGFATKSETGRLVPIRPLGETFIVPIVSDGRFYDGRPGYPAPEVNAANARLAGQYMGTVANFIKTGSAASIRALEAFADKAVVDVHGQNYPLEVDPQVLTELYAFESPQWDEIYRRNG